MILAAMALALAQPDPMIGRPLRLHGVGQLPCSEWTEARRASPPMVAAMQSWALGYVTAFNRYGPQPNGNVVGDASDDALWQEMDSYCAAHPRAPVVEAISKLTQELQRRYPPAPDPTR